MKVHKGPPSSFSTFQPQHTNVHIPLKSKHHLDSNIVYGNDPVSQSMMSIFMTTNILTKVIKALKKSRPINEMFT